MKIKQCIRPSDIDTTRHFFNAFGKIEREVSARWLVKFCQQNGDNWQPFRSEELNDWYKPQDGGRAFRFNGLDSKEYGVIKAETGYSIADQFVARCYLASPKAVEATLKLYVWEHFGPDHGFGIAFALARDSDEARDTIAADGKDYLRAHLGAEPKVYEWGTQAAPLAFFVT